MQSFVQIYTHGCSLLMYSHCQVAPPSLTLAAGASASLAVTLKVLKFADRRKAETTGQRGEPLSSASVRVAFSAQLSCCCLSLARMFRIAPCELGNGLYVYARKVCCKRSMVVHFLRGVFRLHVTYSAEITNFHTPFCDRWRNSQILVALCRYLPCQIVLLRAQVLFHLLPCPPRAPSLPPL